jgi:hypothetical protein
MVSRVKVFFDDESISVIRQDGSRESVRWSDLREVVIKTTDEGPFIEDVFIILIGKDQRSGCLVPQGADGESELFSALQARLPGFDNEKVIEAMSSSENRSFLLWSRTQQS